MKTKILAGTVLLAFAAVGFTLGRGTAPDPVECLTALDAADSAIALLANSDHAERADRFGEIDYPTHRDACKEAIR